jgi:hypothetical protein
MSAALKPRPEHFSDAGWVHRWAPPNELTADEGAGKEGGLAGHMPT